MMLIGKTAYYVIAYSAVIKAVHEFVRMREITRSVKVALKCLITVVLVDVNLPYWTSAIFSNICTAPVQKRLFMKMRCKFRHRRSIPWPRFPVRLVTVQNFGDLATFSVIFAFCMLNVRHIFTSGLFDLLTPTAIIPTKFEVDMTIHCRVTAFFCWYVTWPCDLDLWPFDAEQLTYMAGRVTNLATKFATVVRLRTTCGPAEDHVADYGSPVLSTQAPISARLDRPWNRSIERTWSRVSR